jgi:hypothetical protein
VEYPERKRQCSIEMIIAETVGAPITSAE